MKCAVYQSTRRGRRVYGVDDEARAGVPVTQIVDTIRKAIHDEGYFYSARFKLAEMNEDDGLKAAEYLYKLTQHDFAEDGNWTNGDEVIYRPANTPSSTQCGDLFVFRTRDKMSGLITMRVYVVLNIGCIEIGGPEFAEEIANACVDVQDL